MEKYRKEANLLIGKRLRDARVRLGITQVQIAELFGVTEEHYRKYESGATGLSAAKLLLLYHRYRIDPTYLLTGICLRNEFDVDYYIANSSDEQREVFMSQVFSYIWRMVDCGH